MGGRRSSPNVRRPSRRDGWGLAGVFTIWGAEIDPLKRRLFDSHQFHLYGMAGRRPLTYVEERFLIRVARRLSSRSRALVTTQWFTGFRVSEVLSLTVSSVRHRRAHEPAPYLRLIHADGFVSDDCGSVQHPRFRTNAAAEKLLAVATNGQRRKRALITDDIRAGVKSSRRDPVQGWDPAAIRWGHQCSR